MKRLIPLLLLAACGEPADAPRPAAPAPSEPSVQAPAATSAPTPQATAPQATAPDPNSAEEARRIALEHLQAQHPNRPVVMGEPGPMEGAAGSIFIEVPARVVLEPESLAGTVTLRRVNDVPGSTPEERRWRVYRTDLKPLQ